MSTIASSSSAPRPSAARARSGSAIPFGQEPTPSFQATSSMFCSARPVSRLPFAEDRDHELRARARSSARRPLPPAARATSGDSTTRNRHGCRFFALPARRPASRIRRTTSSGRSRSAYSRTSRRLATASQVSIEFNRTVQVFTYAERPDLADRTDEIGDVFPEFIHHADVTVVHWHRLREELPSFSSSSTTTSATPSSGGARRSRPRRRTGSRAGWTRCSSAGSAPARARSPTCSARWSRSSILAGRARG